MKVSLVLAAAAATASAAAPSTKDTPSISFWNNCVDDMDFDIDGTWDLGQYLVWGKYNSYTLPVEPKHDFSFYYVDKEDNRINMTYTMDNGKIHYTFTEALVPLEGGHRLSVWQQDSEKCAQEFNVPTANNTHGTYPTFSGSCDLTSQLFFTFCGDNGH